MEEVTIQFVNIPEVSLSEYAEQLEVSNEEALAILEGEGVNMDQPTGDPKVLFDAVVEAVDAYRTAADLEAQATAILAKARELRRLIGSNVITVQPGAAPKLERTGCNCYVANLDEETRFVLHHGSHALACPQYSRSLDPVDDQNDRDFRAAHS
jgi:hypothetical protein